MANRWAVPLMLPLPDTVGQIDLERILRYWRFRKVLAEISVVNSDKAQRILSEQLSDKLKIYRREFRSALPDSNKNNLASVGFRINDYPDGRPTLLGLKFHILVA